MKKRLLRGLKWTAIYTVVTFVFFEGLLWILGYRPYTNNDYHVDSSPELPYIGDSQLGIRLNEGQYTLTLNNAVTFKATHLANGQRKIPKSGVDSLPELLFLGCSYTYGYGVNDAESFPALIQKKHTGWNVQNAAVVGYGTAQHLLQLKKRLKKDPPKCVIVSLSSVHFIRTVLSQQYRANLRIGYRRSSDQVDNRMSTARFPYMRKCGKIEYQGWNGMYPEIWGRYWLASANFLQLQYDSAKEPNCDAVDITKCILEEMAELCEKHDVSFGVICLDNSPETRQLQQRVTSIPWKNIGFSFKNKVLTHLPHDSHPNAKGHQKIAADAMAFIEKQMHDDQ